jgi:hypothetical protein
MDTRRKMLKSRVNFSSRSVVIPVSSPPASDISYGPYWDRMDPSKKHSASTEDFDGDTLNSIKFPKGSTDDFDGDKYPIGGRVDDE